MAICDDLEFLDIEGLSTLQIQNLEFVVGDAGKQGVISFLDLLPFIDPITIPVGFTVDFYGGYIPDGWLLLDGSVFSASTYPDLYTLLGDVTLPDYRGRTTVGSVISPNTTGATQGVASITLTENQMAEHSHSYRDTSGILNPVNKGDHTTSKFEGDHRFRASFNPVDVDKDTESVGGGNPVNNLQPQVVVRKLIKGK